MKGTCYKETVRTFRAAHVCLNRRCEARRRAIASMCLCHDVLPYDLIRMALHVFVNAGLLQGPHRLLHFVLEILHNARLERVQGIFEVAAQLLLQGLQPLLHLGTQAAALLGEGRILHLKGCLGSIEWPRVHPSCMLDFASHCLFELLSKGLLFDQSIRQACRCSSIFVSFS